MKDAWHGVPSKKGPVSCLANVKVSREPSNPQLRGLGFRV